VGWLGLTRICHHNMLEIGLATGTRACTTIPEPEAPWFPSSENGTVLCSNPTTLTQSMIDDPSNGQITSAPTHFPSARMISVSVGNDYTVAADERRAAFNQFILERKRPRFTTVYFSGLDDTQHETTPPAPNPDKRSKSSTVWWLKFGLRGSPPVEVEPLICIVSDHGFARTDRDLETFTIP
jgi:hypothetical protein